MPWNLVRNKESRKGELGGELDGAREAGVEFTNGKKPGAL
jgi:hypothetical protein